MVFRIIQQASYKKGSFHSFRIKNWINLRWKDQFDNVKYYTINILLTQAVFLQKGHISLTLLSSVSMLQEVAVKK